MANVYGSVAAAGLSFTNGLPTVTLASGNFGFGADHLNAVLHGPDGFPYTITKITNADNVEITPSYRGQTVSDSQDWAILMSQATAGVLELIGSVNTLIDSVSEGIAGAEYEDDGQGTPELTFATPGDVSIDYTRQVLLWRRIGDLLSVAIEVAGKVTHSTAAGQLIVTGIPLSVPTRQVLALGMCKGISDFDGHMLSAVVLPEESMVRFRRTDAANGTISNVNASNMVSGSDFHIVLTGQLIVS